MARKAMPGSRERVCHMHGVYHWHPEYGPMIECPWCELIVLQRLINRMWRWHFNGPLQEAEPFSDAEARGLAPVLPVPRCRSAAGGGVSSGGPSARPYVGPCGGPGGSVARAIYRVAIWLVWLALWVYMAARWVLWRLGLDRDRR